MILNFRKINWNKGVGSTLLGASMIVLAVIMTIVVFNYSTVFMHAVKVQMIADIVADGSAIWGQRAFKLEASKVTEKAIELINLNNQIQNKMNYVLTGLDITDDYSREGYKDARLDISVSGSSSTIAAIKGQNTNKSLFSVRSAAVLSYAYLPLNPVIPEWAEEIYGQALASVDIGSPQYQAIVESRQFYGWAYPVLRNKKGAKVGIDGSRRLSDGYRDCSSFVSSCYYKYTDEIVLDDYTNSLLSREVATGRVNFANDYDTLFKNIQVGDLIYWKDDNSTRVKSHIMHVSHVGMYLGQSDLDGYHYMMHSSYSNEKVEIRRLDGYNESNLIGSYHVTYTPAPDPTEDILIPTS